MKRFFIILLTVVLMISILLPAAGVLANNVQKTINVKPATLTQQDQCSNGVKLWHFIINQIDVVENAPASIHVIWDNGAYSADVTLTAGGAPVAHYTTTLHAGSKVTDAYTDIYSTWSGNFNLSHVECNTTDSAGKTGMKFDDANQNGVKDNGESGLPNWTIYVDYDGDGILDTDEPFAVTISDGTYFITGITPGTWKVREVEQNGWTCTLPTTNDSKGPFYEETFTGGNTQTDNDFGNFNGGGTPQEEPEVGGEVYPNNTSTIVSIIAGSVVFLSGVGILLRRRLFTK